MSELEGKAAVVTGGGRGVGRGVAEALASAGMSVAVLGRSETELESTATLLRRHGAEALAIRTDVTSRDEVEAALAGARAAFGKIDLLVNNAGRAHALGPPWAVDPDDWWSDVEVNLLGTFLCCHAVLPSMIEQRSGRIVNVTSLAAAGPFPYASAYSSSKAAVLNLTASLAAATREHGVSVFAISPGLVRTRMLDGFTETELGRRWLPEMGERDDHVPPAAAGELVAALATGVADRLSGRFIHVSDDLGAVVAAAEDIVENDRRVLRMAE